MTREQAIDVWTELTKQGYSSSVYARNMGDHVLPNGDNVAYGVSMLDLGYDSIDIKALTKLADGLGVDVVFNTGHGFTFKEIDTTPEVIKNPRRHPVDR